MSFIQLQDVGVVFPIYGASSRSLKQHVIHLGTGGRIGAPEGRVAVEALANITLEFKHGDRVGLVGHNGAGKTTLLRVLGGIYEPTQGAIKVQGRVAPVFDIGLGMDPDSTGYENIRLRGLYLGMTRSEIARRLDEIAAFTELGPFLDMPVRTYSRLRVALVGPLKEPLQQGDPHGTRTRDRAGRYRRRSGSTPGHVHTCARNSRIRGLAGALLSE
jgi:ABC-type polysaccharide/polyol phosphate transport system ATPase subunit